MANFSLAVGKPSNYTTSGASDASPDGTPSQFLLLRGLEPTVTEDIMAKGVTKLYKPSRMSPPPATGNTKKAKVASTTGDANLGAKEGTLRRVLLVRSRKTNESWRYGFAEFDKLEVRISLVRWIDGFLLNACRPKAPGITPLLFRHIVADSQH